MNPSRGLVKPHTSPRGGTQLAKRLRGQHRAWKRSRIRQIDIDFVCLAIFGSRCLPDDMATRIAEFRDFHMAGTAAMYDKWRSFGWAAFEADPARPLLPQTLET